LLVKTYLSLQTQSRSWHCLQKCSIALPLPPRRAKTRLAGASACGQYGYRTCRAGCSTALFPSEWRESREFFILIVCPTQEIPVGAPQINAEAHFSTQPSTPFQDARFSYPYEDKERKGRALPPPRQRKEARLREARLPRVISFGRECPLRVPSQP
jgi:hypothetical protein